MSGPNCVRNIVQEIQIKLPHVSGLHFKSCEKFCYFLIKELQNIGVKPL